MQDRRLGAHSKSISLHTDLVKKRETTKSLPPSKESLLNNSRNSSLKSPMITPRDSQPLSDSLNSNSFYLHSKTPTLDSNEFTEDLSFSSGGKFSAENSAYCPSCKLLKRKEEVLCVQAIVEISNEIKAILNAVNAWKEAEMTSFNYKQRGFKAEKSKLEITEVGFRILELRSLINLTQETIGGLTKNIEILSKTATWEKIQIKRPQDIKGSTNILDSIKQARAHLHHLKSTFNTETTEIPSDNMLTKCLQLQLQQSKREKRELELQLKLPSNPTPEIVYKVIEQLIQEKS
ncbi:unnamed protein product [Blepharisma stoltei]|uniref:Uncharacterized protein n=1 Tax=Blepharisma stoltei TaxID=1481888 RepID=A0AAU9K4E9_9CILI|nr:unnamed protein product [Blepharisma stoltei]